MPERTNPSAPWVALPELDLAFCLDRGRLVAAPLVAFEEGGTAMLYARQFAVDPFAFGDEARASVANVQTRLRRADTESDLYIFGSQYVPVGVFFENRVGLLTLEDLEALARLGDGESVTIGGDREGLPAVDVKRVARPPVRQGDAVEFYREVNSRPPYTIPRSTTGRVTLVTRDEIHVTLDHEITADSDASHTLRTVVYQGSDPERGRDVFFLDTMPANAA